MCLLDKKSKSYNNTIYARYDPIVNLVVNVVKTQSMPQPLISLQWQQQTTQRILVR